MKSFHRRALRPAPQAVSAPPPVERHGLQRADSLLVAQGLAPSRSLARRLIEAGRVRAGGVTILKASQELPSATRLEVAPSAANTGNS